MVKQVINNGESGFIVRGKLNDNFTELYTDKHSHSNKSDLDGITATLIGQRNTAYTNNHTHSNKSDLDGITGTLISQWNTAYSQTHTHANKLILDIITNTGAGTMYLSDDGTYKTIGPSMVYPDAGIPLSTGSAWGTSITNNSGNWNTAYGRGNHASAGYELQSHKDAVGGYAGLDINGKINPSQLPSIAITDTFVVTSEAEQLALTCQTGDVAIRTDEHKTYILQGTDPTIFANWKRLETPTDIVQSVFGRSGVVTAQNGDYTADQITETLTRVFLSPAQKVLATQYASASVSGLLSTTDWNTFNNKQASLGFTPEDVSNKVTSITGLSTDTQYPSAKLLYDQLLGYAKINGSNTPFTGDISIGSTVAGKNLSVFATLGAEKIPAFVSTDWILGGGASIVGGHLIKSASGTSASSPNVGGVTPTPGKTYKVTITITVTAQTVSFSYGGITKSGITGTYTDYITAKTTDNLNIRTPLTSGRFDCASISVMELADGTGQVTAKNFVMKGPIKDYNGNDIMTSFAGGAFFSRIGIGLAAPTESTTYLLSVNGKAMFGTSGNSSYQVSIYNGTSGVNTGGLYLRNGGGSANSGINIAMVANTMPVYLDCILAADTTSCDFAIRTTKASTVTSEIMRIVGLTGYVGIGTTAPTCKLDVVGNIKASGFITGVPCGVSTYLNSNEAITIASGLTFQSFNGSFTDKLMDYFDRASDGTNDYLEYSGPTQAFKIDWFASFTTDNDTTRVSICVMNNLSPSPGSEIEATNITLGMCTAMSGSDVIELSTGGKISFGITGRNNGDVIRLKKFIVTINEFHD